MAPPTVPVRAIAAGQSPAVALSATAPSPAPAEAFPSFNSESLDQQIQRYRAYLQQYGTPDILILGSSRALWGLDPIVLQSILVREGYPQLKIYNLGVNGATARVVDLLVRQILTPEQLPRLIIWADGSRAFNNGRIDRTYQKIVTSPGYRRLQAGQRPIPPPPPAATLGQVCLELPTVSESILDGLVQPTATDPVTGCPTAGQLSLHLAQPPEPTAENVAALRQAAGFEAQDAKFNPNLYYRQYPRVPGRYDADYRRFSLQGAQTQALRNVLTFAHQQDIQVVFVNLPLSQPYLDATRAYHEQQFLAFLRRFERYRGLRLYDLSWAWQTRYDFFKDPSHLNRYGAAAVAVWLGRTLRPPLIPAKIEQSTQ